jgi:hypothetical protein
MEDMVGLEVDWRRVASSRLTGQLQPLHAQLFQQRPAFLPTEAEFLPPSELLLNQAQFHEECFTHIALESRAHICKCLRRPGIDSEESIPPAYEA